MGTMRFESYEEAVAQHEWNVPERYNIAADVCDKHPADKLAMIHEDFDGTVREVRWGELQESVQPLRQRAARARRRAGRPRRDAAAADARDGRRVLRHLQVRGDPALDVGALRRRRHPPPRERLAGEGAGHQRGQRGPRRPVAGRARAAARRRAARRAATPTFEAATRSPTTRRSSTTPPARPASPRASSTRTATCSRTRSSSTATTCRRASSSTAWASGRGRPGIAPLLGPWRFGAVQFVYQREGGFDPHKQLDVLSRHERHERLHDADRDALDDVDRGRRQALPAEVPRSSARPASR